MDLRARFWLQTCEGNRCPLHVPHQRCVEDGIFLGEPDINAVCRLTLCVFPGMRPVDRLSILIEPGSQGLETLHLHSRNCAVGLRADIEEQVAVLAHDINEQVDELVGRDGLRFTLGAVVAERLTQPATFLHFCGLISLSVEYSGVT